MDFEIYKQYVFGTLESYSQKENTHFKRDFLKTGIAYIRKNGKDPQISTSMSYADHPDSGIDISEMGLIDSVKYVIEHSKNALKLFELWEFIKDFKYSILFETEDFESLYQNIIKDEKIAEFDLISNESEIVPISDGLNTWKLVRYNDEERLFLKFIFDFNVVSPETRVDIFTKYPVIMVLHKNLRMVELRYSSLKSYFKPSQSDATFYIDEVRKIRSYVSRHYSSLLTPINMDNVKQIVKANETAGDKSVRLLSQSMKMASGGSAQLDVGINEDYTLPFIDEVKEIMSKHSEALIQFVELKNDLERFIYEKEEMSEFPWITLLWDAENKSKSIQAKLIFNYMESDFCLIQHYYSGSLIGMERMNHVAEYIFNNRSSTN